MKALRIILILSLVVLIHKGAYCQSENPLVSYDLKDLPKITKVKLSDLGFDDIEYIPLETTENSLISNITEIKPGIDFFIVQHFTSILKFKKDGSFVTKIGTVGRGPNEFTVVHDLDIDKKTNKIYLVSAWQRRFFVYSESGKFIRTFQSPLNSSSFKITDDGILCYSINSFSNIETSYNLIDTAGRIIKEFQNKYLWHLSQKNAYVFIHENLFYRSKGSLYKKEVYSDTVYQFAKMSFKPHLVIELGERQITPKDRSNYSPDQIMDRFIDPVNLFEVGDYIYYEIMVNYNGHGETLSFIGSNKNNFQALVDPYNGILNDLDGGPNIWPKTIKDDNTIISWIDAIKLKNLVASEAFKNSTPKYPEKKQELVTLANSLNETDNPVLILIKLK